MLELTCSEAKVTESKGALQSGHGGGDETSLASQ